VDLKKREYRNIHFKYAYSILYRLKCGCEEKKNYQEMYNDK